MNFLFSMMSSRRYLALIFVLVVSIHYILSLVIEDYGRISSLANLSDQISKSLATECSSDYSDTLLNIQINPNTTSPANTSSVTDPRRANATFVFLCRNNDLAGAVSSIQQMEDRFNRKYKYPWVLLNEEPFTEEFKERISVLTDAPVSFGQIPHDHWYQPDWIDENKARSGRLHMMAQGIIYAGGTSHL